MSLPKETAQRAQQAAEAAGLSVSAWIAQAIEREAQFHADLAEVEEYVATLGISEAEWDDAEALVARALARGVRTARTDAS